VKTPEEINDYVKKHGSVPETALPANQRIRSNIPDCCRSRSATDGFGCTLTIGHKGFHIAHGPNGEAYAAWWPSESEEGQELAKTPVEVIERIVKQMGRTGQLWDYRIFGINSDSDKLSLGFSLVREGKADDHMDLAKPDPTTDYFHVEVPVTFGEPIVTKEYQR
jgi:hypothetical protein